MAGLLLSDLKENAGRYLWTVLCAAVGAACATGCCILITSALPATKGHGDMAEGINVVGANVVTYTVLAAFGVVAATVGLALASQRRSHALWLVAGVSRIQLFGLLVGQLMLMGVAGGAVGVVPSLAVARIGLSQWASADLAPQHVGVHLEAWHVVACLGFGVLACLVGGLGAAIRSSVTPEMAALKDVDAASSGIPWLGLGISLFLAIGWGALVVVPLTGYLKDPQERAGAMMGANLLGLCMVLLVGKWTLRAFMYAWTALVPGFDPAWHLARAACRTRAARSITTVMPFALALSLLSVLVGGGNATGASVSIEQMIVLLSWMVVVSWVGGIAVIAMAARERGRDSALVSVAGATRGVVIRSIVYEGAIYAVTAILFALVSLAITVTSVAGVAHLSIASGFARAPWADLGWMALATLVTSCGAVLAAALRTARQPVTQVLRAE